MSVIDNVVERDHILDGEVTNAPVKRFEGDFERINVGSSDVHILAKYSKTDKNYLLNYLKSIRSRLPDSITVAIPHDMKKDVLAGLDTKLKHHETDPWSKYYFNETIGRIIIYLKDCELPPTGVVIFCMHINFDVNNIYIIVPEKPIERLFYGYGEHFYMGPLDQLR